VTRAYYLLSTAVHRPVANLRVALHPPVCAVCCVVLVLGWCVWRLVFCAGACVLFIAPEFGIPKVRYYPPYFLFCASHFCFEFRVAIRDTV
jgi:hypothetical protein